MKRSEKPGTRRNDEEVVPISIEGVCLFYLEIQPGSIMLL